ncbi:hypothetical protein AP75_08195 [Kaistella haifensis DSM 19056]|uniref:Uncharacterized protein n=1 Tax=Kaistella haifensis DSM 19056 TaxID=1450526 RepID=A0A2D0A6B7_9FLAO|nr:hypothetical protein AP75_08195 [Kaistella haifensis DSM 19056]
MTKTQVKNDKIKRQIYAGSQSFGIFGKKAIIQNLKVTKKNHNKILQATQQFYSTDTQTNVDISFENKLFH